MMDDDGV